MATDVDNFTTFGRWGRVEKVAQAVGDVAVSFARAVLVSHRCGVRLVPKAVHQLGKRCAGYGRPGCTRPAEVVEVERLYTGASARLGPSRAGRNR